MRGSGFDYASFYAALDEGHYHRTNTSSNELVFLPLLQQLGLARGAAVASLGCGTCAVLPRLRSDLAQADVYGMEVSPKVLEVARQLGRDGPCSPAPCLRRGSLTQLTRDDLSQVETAIAEWLTLFRQRHEVKRAGARSRKSSACAVL